MIIHDTTFVLSATAPEHFPATIVPEFLFLGRSNVGKSTFINTLLRRNNIARISATPGKTQMLNFFLVNDAFHLVDAPGYGYAKVSKRLRESFGQMIETYLLTRNQLRMTFLLVDFRHEPTEDDLLMLDYLRYANQPITIIATKKDKVNKTHRIKHESKLRLVLSLKENEKLIIVSAVTKEGIEEVHQVLSEALDVD